MTSLKKKKKKGKKIPFPQHIGQIKYKAEICLTTGVRKIQSNC